MWKVTEDIKARMVELRKDGCTYKEIADAVGCHPSTVSGALRGMEYDLNAKATREIRRLAPTMSKTEIAQKLNLDLSKVSRICKKHGIEAKKHVRGHYKLTESQLKSLLSVAPKTYLKDLAKRYKLTPETTRKILRKYGVSCKTIHNDSTEDARSFDIKEWLAKRPKIEVECKRYKAEPEPRKKVYTLFQGKCGWYWEDEVKKKPKVCTDFRLHYQE